MIKTVNFLTLRTRRRAVAGLTAAIFAFTAAISPAEEVFSAGTLAAPLKTASREFKERYVVSAICRLIEREGDTDQAGTMQDVFDRLKEVKNGFKNISFRVTSEEIIIDVPDEGLAIRYIDPSSANVITPYPDLSALKTVAVNPGKLNRQIIRRGEEKSGAFDGEELVPAERSIWEAIRGLKARGVSCVLAGRDLSELDPREAMRYLKAFCVVRDEETIYKLMEERIAGRNKEIFEAVFNPLDRLKNRRKAANDPGPLEVVHVRGGRGASTATKIWTSFAKDGLVELSIIPGAVDDGRSWADLAYMMGCTGVPDIGKCVLDMARDEDAAYFASLRLTDDPSVDPASVLEEVFNAFNGAEYKNSQRDVKRIMGAFNDLDPDRQETVRQTVSVFLGMIGPLVSEGRLSVRGDLPLRSAMILGARGIYGTWQKAADSLGSFVDSAGRVILPTEKRLYAMAILEDGMILPTENSINEMRKQSGYLYFSLGERPFTDLVDGIFQHYLGRNPDDEERRAFDRARHYEHDQPEYGRFFIRQLFPEGAEVSEEDIMGVVRHIDGIFSAANANNPTETQKEAVEKIEKAGLMIYGPTDVESNIASAVMYPGISSAIRKNDSAAKVLITNSRDSRGVEPPRTTAGSLAGRLYRWLSAGEEEMFSPGAEKTGMRDYIQYILGRGNEYENPDITDYIPFDEENIHGLGAEAVAMDLEMTTLKGSGGAVVENLPYRHMERGEYNGGAVVDAVLSLALLKELGVDLGGIDEMFQGSGRRRSGQGETPLKEETLADMESSLKNYADNEREKLLEMLGDGKPDILLRLPVQSIEGPDKREITGLVETFQMAPNAYVELFDAVSPLFTGEDLYSRAGIRRKDLPATLKNGKRTTQNTVTLLLTEKDEKLSPEDIRTRIGDADMDISGTILSPVGTGQDRGGVVRALMFGMGMMRIARAFNEPLDRIKAMDKNDGRYSELKDKAQELLEAYKNVSDPETPFVFRDSDMDSFLGFIEGDINCALRTLNKLTALLPAAPMDTEALRRVYEHARKVLKSV